MELSWVPPSARGGIFRHLAIPFSAFLVTASLALIAWIDHSHHRESLRQLREMATANAEMVDRLRLPPSPDLAEKLAGILGFGVGFRFPDRVGDGVDPEFRDSIERLSSEDAASERVGRWEIAVAPMAGGRVHIVLIRETERFLADTPAWLLPVLIVTALGGGIAFLIARRIVRPLGIIHQWLPNLDQDSPAPLPAAVTGRGDEIGSLARSLETSHRRLREEQALRRQAERLAPLGRIATSLAHEIRNPAAAIRLHADLLARRAEADDAESIDLIRDETDRITDLVNQWLFVARAAPPRTEARDLGALVQRVVDRLSPQMAHAGVTAIVSSLERDPPGHSATIDGPRIEQVFRNLLLNATQAMPEGGVISLELDTTKAGFVEVRILDQGHGFSAEALRRWREPFFSQREGGMGLGLTLVAEVIEAHGGSIEIENIPGSGARVTCRLPAPGPPPDPLFPS